jgi:hypothetical protein
MSGLTGPKKEAPIVSTQGTPKGTSGHAKGMADAVHLHTSERGNTFPRLLLAVDYRDAKHIRMRAYEPDGRVPPELKGYKVADTLGCNDIAEAALWAGLTIRYGETMHARNMR